MRRRSIGSRAAARRHVAPASCSKATPTERPGRTGRSLTPTARERRTKADWALEVGSLMEGRYADCEKVTVVLDHLNTHTQGAFYTAFEATRARELVRRIEFCSTPQHGRGLNSAENELSAMTRQGLSGRRIGDLETLRTELATWSEGVNTRQRGVDWRMKIVRVQ